MIDSKNPKHDIVIQYTDGTVSELTGVRYFDDGWAILLFDDIKKYIIPKTSIKTITLLN